MKTRLALLAASAAALVLLAPAAHAAAPTVELKPGDLDRGKRVAVPHVEGSTIVDGSLRIKLAWPQVTLLGTSGTAYVVTVADKNGLGAKTFRIRPDDSKKLLVKGRGAQPAVLSQDGAHLVTTPRMTRKHTLVKVLDARTGTILNTRTFNGTVSVLDVDQGRAVMGAWSPDRTFWWEFDGTDDTTNINGRTGYAADIRADRVASYNRDPYDGGCSIVTALSAPAPQLWKSCDDRVATFSPTGERMATIHILSDGLGPNRVTLRDSDGTGLARYTAKWFGALVWETSSALLLDTYGSAQSATVRCDVTDCDRASKLRPTPSY